MPALLLDLFGTLIKTGSDEVVHQRISEELARIHRYVFTPEEHLNLYRKLVEKGLGSGEAVWEALMELSRKKGFKVVVGKDEVFRMHVELHASEATLYEDVLQALSLGRSLFGRLALVSDSDVDVARAILDRLGIGKFFDAVVVSGEIGVRKPDPRLFLEAARRLKVNAGECIMIGDTWKDVEGAKKAGMRAILLVRDGESSETPSTQPDAVAGSLVEAVDKAWKLLKDGRLAI